MDALSFGKDLWDQVKQLEKYCEFGAEQLISMNEFLKIVSNAELEYGKALLRAVKPYKEEIKKLQEKTEKYPFYKAVTESTSIKSWEKMLDSYESLGSLRVETAEIFLNERKLIKTTSKDIEGVFKEVIIFLLLKFEEIKRGANQLTDMIAMMEKNYSNYKRELKDLDTCTAQYKKSLKDLKMSKKDMDKIKMDYDKQILASQEAVKCYRESVIELNKFKNTTSSAVLPKEQAIIGEAIAVNDAVRSSLDHDALIKSLKTGLEPPLDFSIADTSEVHSKKLALRSSSRDELRLDYESESEITKLPDKQGKKKAMEKIKLLDKEIVEVEKQRQGVDILKGAYKDSLNDVEVKLNQLLTQKHRLHCYVAKIDGKPAPEAPAFVSSPKNMSEAGISSSSVNPPSGSNSHPSNGSISNAPNLSFSHPSNGSNSQEAPATSTNSPGDVRKLKVLYDFVADSNSPEEMSVNSGDILILVKENGDG
ncbi:hypothetical protein HK103_003329 [Boothiomyces macroporosus]|uniref:SH3 domain-containing protein n=1 Tax=Boothiomyces macroporosus TaxID=261099 RepID=A0AAD5UI27_9FUNG|nr:hypothetical protein HK103_003329 [Boothiomyces macroporosus]